MTWITTTLPNGEYCDVYASRDCSKTVTVSGGHVKTTIGKRSAIALYQGAVAESDPGKGVSMSRSTVIRRTAR